VVQGASSCSKIRRIKSLFEDQEDYTGNEGADIVDASAGLGAADACAASAADTGACTVGADATCLGEVPAAPAQAPSPEGKAVALGAKKLPIT
jgi:hypothetical protein